eukprot:gene30958-37417_t
MYQKFDSELEHLEPYSIGGYASIPESPNLSVAESSVDTAMELDGDQHGPSSASIWQWLNPFMLFTWATKMCFHPNVIFVSVLMLAEGSEEIIVFSPLFATATSKFAVFCMVVTMYILCTLLCVLALLCLRCGSVASVVSRYSKNFLPLLLIALGLAILQDSALGEGRGRRLLVR